MYAMSGPGVTFSMRPAATKSAMSWMPVIDVSPPRNRDDPIRNAERERHSCGVRTRVTRHQRVRMDPARCLANSREPVAQMRIAIPVNADLLGPEQVTARSEERRVGKSVDLGGRRNV